MLIDEEWTPFINMLVFCFCFCLFVFVFFFHIGDDDEHESQYSTHSHKHQYSCNYIVVFVCEGSFFYIFWLDTS